MREFLDAVNETPKKPGRYHRWLLDSLIKLDSFKIEDLLKMNTRFEYLKETDPKLYAIRYPKSKKNPRVVYFYQDNNRVILLKPFLEKKPSDYTHAINAAYTRIKQLEE